MGEVKFIRRKCSIADKLIHCKKGKKLYSPAYGELFYDYIENYDGLTKAAPMIVCYSHSNNIRKFFVDGTLSTNGKCMLFPSENETDWDKFEVKVIPEFNVGDKIISKGTKSGFYYVVEAVSDEGYMLYRPRTNNRLFVSVYEQYKYELKPTFDYHSLQAFDKVLVRNVNNPQWHIDFFESFDGTTFTCMISKDLKLGEVIPYNLETEELLGTIEEPCSKYVECKS